MVVTHSTYSSVSNWVHTTIVSVVLRSLRLGGIVNVLVEVVVVLEPLANRRTRGISSLVVKGSSSVSSSTRSEDGKANIVANPPEI